MKRPVPRSLLLPALLLAAMFPALTAAQQVRIAELGMASASAESYQAFSAVVAGFDIVAADSIRDPGVVEKVLGGLEEGWGAVVSRSSGFGFIFSERMELKKDLGTFPGKSQRANPPYGAQFRVAGTRFLFNLIVCRRTTESTLPASVHRYFEELTGNHGITLLLFTGQDAAPKADRLFTSPTLRPRIRETGVAATALRPAFVVLNTRP